MMSILGQMNRELIEEQSNQEPEDLQERMPSNTYKIDFKNKRIIGRCDGHQSVFQAVQKILRTDRYAWAIYDWYLGNEILTLVGKPLDFVISEIPRMVIEALSQDDRITNVLDFKFKKTNIDSLEVSFTVVTIFSTFTYSLEVRL